MGTHPIFESDFDCLTENMTSIIRAQNQIVRLIRGSNGRIRTVKRPLSVSCVSSNLEDFHKHRRKQKIMEEISEDAKKNFDSRTGKFLRIPPTIGEMAHLEKFSAPIFVR